MRIENDLNILDFFVTGEANFSAALTRANAAAASQNKPLFFPSGIYKLGKTSYTINGGKTNWYSNGQAILDWDDDASFPASAAIKIKDSGTSYTQRDRKVRTVLKGFAIRGGYQGANIAGTAIKFEGDASNITHHKSIKNISILGFDTCLEFTDNVWFITLDRVHTLWGGIITPSTASNFGESMTMRDCMFADASSKSVSFLRGSWKIFNSSFDNLPVIVSNDAQVDVFGGHFENPVSSSTTYRYGIINNEASLNLHGCTIVHNTPSGGPRTVPLFNVNTDPALPVGLALNDCSISAWNTDNYNTLDGYNHYVLSSGTGRVTAKNLRQLAWGNYNYEMAVGNGMQALRNGTFEGSGSGSVSGWAQKQTSGGDGTYNLTSSNIRAKSGSYSMLIETIRGSSNQYQEVESAPAACRGGDLIVGGLWRYGDFADGEGSIQTSLAFYDGSGSFIEKYDWSQSTTSSADWSYKRLGYVAPSGAEKVSIRIYVYSTSGTVRCYIDEVLLNVVSR